MIENSSKNLKYFIRTLGCQMNVADSDLIASHLSSLGMKQTDDASRADIIILNTCTVRQQAENRAMSFIGRLHRNLRNKKSDKQKPTIIVVGCVAERLGEDIKKQFPIVDLVVGAKSIEYFPEIFDKHFSSALVSSSSPIDTNHHSGPPMGRVPVSTFVIIMRGCENYCSYCIVPYVRGKERSRSPEEIIDEIKILVKNGVKEVTLLGQNVNSYKAEVRSPFHPGRRACRRAGKGNQKSEVRDFADLLVQVNEIKGLERIRFMTSHPKDISDKLIDKIINLEKVCKHLHLPLQSGSDKILKTMNRGYTDSDYMCIVDKLRKSNPQIGLTTDILVGFSGETDKDFHETLSLIKKIEFDFMFAFKYSSRPGTKAASFSDNVPQDVKEERLAKILDTAYGISTQKNAKLIGTTQKILVEEKRNGQFVGNSSSNKKVFFRAHGDLTGRMVDVEITGSKVNSLTGKMKSE